MMWDFELDIFLFLLFCKNSISTFFNLLKISNMAATKIEFKASRMERKYPNVLILLLTAGNLIAEQIPPKHFIIIDLGEFYLFLTIQ